MEFRKMVTITLYVAMPFSQIIPPPPSPTESKRLFYTSVSLLPSHIQGYCYHLSKFHIYYSLSSFKACGKALQETFFWVWVYSSFYLKIILDLRKTARIRVQRTPIFFTQIYPLLTFYPICQLASVFFYFLCFANVFVFFWSCNMF